MGDLKKNWAKYHQGEESPDDAVIDVEILTDHEAKTIECLRMYMKKFYEMQKEKEENNGKEGE